MKFLHEIILSSSSKHGSPEILETGLGFAPSFFINGRPNVSVGDAHINVDAEDDVSKIEEGGRKREREEHGFQGRWGDPGICLISLDRTPSFPIRSSFFCPFQNITTVR